MTDGHTGAEFSIEPTRPAPSTEFKPSQKVIDKLVEMLPKIQEVKTAEEQDT